MLSIRENVSLKEYSSFKIGGPSKYFCEPRSTSEVREAALWAKEKQLPIFIFGGGTNLLIDDNGFHGLIIKPYLNVLGKKGIEVTVGAGVLVKDFLAFCIAHALQGFEWAGGLPGTMGGAIRGNAGAFGGETKDSVISVKSFYLAALEEKMRTNEECVFGYRTSVFKEKRGEEMVLEAIFRFREGEREKIREAVEAKINYRKEKHPLEYPNIGSIFKNVDARKFSERDLRNLKIKNDPFPVVPTAVLIAEAGLKGIREGDAMVSLKHPNFIVNLGGAKASEVKTLIRRVKEAVKKKFGVELEEEVQFVP